MTTFELCAILAVEHADRVYNYYASREDDECEYSVAFTRMTSELNYTLDLLCEYYNIDRKKECKRGFR